MAVSNDYDPAVQGCLDAIQRCEKVIEAFPEDLYRGEDGSINAVGAHLRHGLDHLVCLLRGMDSGLVDYDLRDRDRVLEHDAGACGVALAEAARNLEAIGADRLPRRIQVRQTAALGTDPITSESTVARELAFVSGHFIHHLAMIAILADHNGVDLPEGFALAFSTAAYRSLSRS